MTVSPEDQDLRTDEAFTALLGSADPRPRPSKHHEHAVRQVVHAEWRHSTRRRKRRRWTLLSLAAGLAVVVLGANFLTVPWSGSTTLEDVASIEKRVGEVTVDGNAIATGAASYAALAWVNNASLRLAENTRIEIDSAERIYLAAGSVYFDSSPAGLVERHIGGVPPGVLEIRTDEMVVSPRGTRFLTTVAGGQIVVRVREGAVIARGQGFETVAEAGRQIVHRGSGMPTSSAASAFGDAWDWVERTSPPIDTEGRTVSEFLNWVGRETGRTLRYEGDSAEHLARTSVLVGYGRMDLEPSVALRVVMLSTDLEWRIDGGEIVLSVRRLTGFNRRI